MTNGLTLLAAALLRTDPDVLGAIAVVSALVMLQTDAVRAWVVLPAQLSDRASAQRRVGLEGLAAGVPLAALAGIVGLCIGSTALVAAALCLPGIALFETLRGLRLGERNASKALRWDLAWLGSTGALLLATWLRAAVSASTLTVVWLLPGAVLAVAAWAVQSPDSSGRARSAAPDWRVRVSYLADTVIGQFSNLLPIALAAFLGAGAASVWQGARLAFRPIGIGGNLLPVVVPPLLVGGGGFQPVNPRTLLWRVSLWTATAALLCLPVSLVLQVYRHVSAPLAMSWALLVAFEYVAVNGLTVTQTEWKVAGTPVTAVRLRSVATSAALAGLVFAVALGVALFAQIGVVVGLITALAWSVAESRRHGGDHPAVMSLDAPVNSGRPSA